MSEIKQPADRKSKVTKFSFEAPVLVKDAEGKPKTVVKKFTLPLASEGASEVPGKFTRDAVMGEDDAAEIRLGFALLEASGANQDAIDALYSLPSERMLKTLGEWMKHGDGEGATVPQS